MPEIFSYWPDVSHLAWWEVTLMCIGAVYLITHFLWPLIWSLMYMIGYTIFHTRALLETRTWRKYPFTCIRYILWSWPTRGLIEALTQPVDACTIKGLRWEPPFKYYRNKGYE